jgi:hypothetical protein
MDDPAMLFKTPYRQLIPTVSLFSKSRERKHDPRCDLGYRQRRPRWEDAADLRAPGSQDLDSWSAEIRMRARSSIWAGGCSQCHSIVSM